MNTYSKTFSVRWADLDPYQHMRHTAYYDYCTHVRFSYFADNGFDQKEVERRGVGPILLREEGVFLREITEGEEIRVEIRLQGLSDDGARFRVVHDLYRRDGIKAAVVTIDGGWIDTNKRKFGQPPQDMVALLAELEKSESFETLPNVRKRSDG